MDGWILLFIGWKCQFLFGVLATLVLPWIVALLSCTLNAHNTALATWSRIHILWEAFKGKHHTDNSNK
jgi:hypothetical protein